MKKNIIALAIATAVAAPVAMADAPTIYGQLNLNINKTDDQSTTVNSTASRMGIKGSEDLGNGLKAIYMIEFGVDQAADGDGKSPLSARNQYLGLAGGFGTVLMGRHDTPTKMIQPDDLFNDGAADVNKLTNGIVDGEVRAPDVLAYVSPEFGGVKLIAAAIMDEKASSKLNEANDSATFSDNWTNVALTYGSTKKGLYAAGSFQQADRLDVDVIRVAAQYKTGALIVNAMHQDVSGDTVDGTALAGNFTHLQAGYKMGKFMPKVKIAMADSDANGDETAYSVGLNYSLGKKTTGYIYYTEVEDMVSKNATATAAAVKGNNSVIVGLLHKF